MYKKFNDIPLHSNWIKVEPLLKGWSEDEKYYIEDRNGDRFLLRLSDISLYDKKKIEFEKVKLLTKFNINIPTPVDMGICNDGNMVYILFTWLDGIDARDNLTYFDKAKQYKLGVQAGKILKKIHSIKPNYDLPPWEIRFKVAIDRVIDAYKNCGYKIENEGKILNFIRENEKYLVNRPMVFQHGDYHLGNMIITPDNNLGIIDFNRSGYGDPWKEFDRYVFTWGVSTEFANGQLHGYFNNKVPDEFFRLMALYSARNIIASIPWSLSFGEEELKTALDNIKKVNESYNGFSAYIPNWYRRPEEVYPLC